MGTPERSVLADWAAEKGLYFRSSSFALPQATQLLRHGFMREVTGLVRGDLPGDLKGAWLANVAYVFEGMNDLERSSFTLVLVEAPESLGFAERVLCHDRGLSKLDMSNPDSDREVITAPDRSIRLESEAFLRRFSLFVDTDQVDSSVWRLFPPTLIDWMTHQAPAGFSFELQDGALCAFVPGTPGDGASIDELCLAAARVEREVARIGEGSIPSASGRRVDPRSRDGKVEARLAAVNFDSPPKDVKRAAKAFREGLLIGDEGWKLGAEAFFREQSAAAGFTRIDPSVFRASHLQTFLPGAIAQVAAGNQGSPFQGSFLVFTDNTEYDTMGWTVLVADGASPFAAGRGALPSGVSSERGEVKVNFDGRSLIFSTLDGGPRDRNGGELRSFLTACSSVLNGGETAS